MGRSKIIKMKWCNEFYCILILFAFNFMFGNEMKDEINFTFAKDLSFIKINPGIENIMIGQNIVSYEQNETFYFGKYEKSNETYSKIMGLPIDEKTLHLPIFIHIKSILLLEEMFNLVKSIVALPLNHLYFVFFDIYIF